MFRKFPTNNSFDPQRNLYIIEQKNLFLCNINTIYKYRVSPITGQLTVTRPNPKPAGYCGCHYHNIIIRKLVQIFGCSYSLNCRYSLMTALSHTVLCPDIQVFPQLENTEQLQIKNKILWALTHCQIKNVNQEVKLVNNINKI